MKKRLTTILLFIGYVCIAQDSIYNSNNRKSFGHLLKEARKQCNSDVGYVSALNV